MKILQIGTNNGNDHVFDYVNSIKDHVELVILVEPMPQCIPLIETQYTGINNVIIENVAITNQNGPETMTLYYLVDSNYEGSSFSKDHVRSLNPYDTYDIDELIVPCTTINKLMDKHKLTYIDHLFIDAEALDVAIVKSIDFSIYSFKSIEFEMFHSEKPESGGIGSLDSVIKLLNENGYISAETDNVFNITFYNENLL